MGRNPSRSNKTLVERFRYSKKNFSSLLLCLDAILVALIIFYVPHTKIDWDAYMSQVDGFLSGERDYSKLKGDTGPLVYPAGFLYVYSLIKFVTGDLVFPAQILFGIMYINNLALVQFIYLKADVGLSFKGVFLALLGAGLLQIGSGLPFLASYPMEYISRAFNLGRVFIHFWSVNCKFVPEKVFVSKEFASALLFLHLTILLLFAHYKWSKYEGGLVYLLCTRLKDAASTLLSFKIFSCKSRLKMLNKEHAYSDSYVCWKFYWHCIC